MKTLVIGANGATGRAVTAELLTQGHEVSAFVRRPGAMGELGDRVRLIVGDVMTPDDVDRAVAGHDAVVVVLGIKENPLRVRFRGAAATASNVRSAGTRNVVAAMRRHGVPRLVVQSTHGAGETRRKLSWFWKLMFWLILKPQLVDTNLQETIVRDSDLDWVLVRPVSLKDTPPGDVLVSTSGDTRSMDVPRRSVARVLVDALTGRRQLGQALSVSA